MEKLLEGRWSRKRGGAKGGAPRYKGRTTREARAISLWFMTLFPCLRVVHVLLLLPAGGALAGLWWSGARLPVVQPSIGGPAVPVVGVRWRTRTSETRTEGAALPAVRCEPARVGRGAPERVLQPRGRPGTRRVHASCRGSGTSQLDDHQGGGR